MYVFDLFINNELNCIHIHLSMVKTSCLERVIHFFVLKKISHYIAPLNALQTVFNRSGPSNLEHPLPWHHVALQGELLLEDVAVRAVDEMLATKNMVFGQRYS